MVASTNYDVVVQGVNRVYKAHHKADIAEEMIQSALLLHSMGAKPFSVIHLARAAAEVLNGLMKHGLIADNEAGEVRPYDQHLAVFGMILEAHSTPLNIVLNEDGHLRLGEPLERVTTEPTEEKVWDRFNRVRNAIKHHGEDDGPEVFTCASLEADSALDLAIETYFRCRNSHTVEMLRYLGASSGCKLGAPRLSRDA